MEERVDDRTEEEIRVVDRDQTGEEVGSWFLVITGGGVEDRT